MAGAAGTVLNRGKAADRPAAAAVVPGASEVSTESTYWQRTDPFEEKVRLLQAAWARKDFRLVRALTHSLRTTAVQAQEEETDPGAPVMASGEVYPVADLPAAWREWAAGWKRFKVLEVRDDAGLEHPLEPVEILVAFRAGEVRSLQRELRLAQVVDGRLVEVPCQVHGEVKRGGDWLCRVLFLTACPALGRKSFLLFHDNPDAELPEYPSTLVTAGEGFGLDIDNEFYRASLSRQMGQLERLTLKREHGLELFSGGEGHGEPPGIDWAHDYVAAGSFQKFRISLWESCPDYEVIRGPLCTVVRRWGFPNSPLHPLFSPSRVHVDIEYRFYAGLPWFEKIGTMRAVKPVRIETLRDDEWVFSGHSFTEKVWMGEDGRFRLGEVDAGAAENLWAAGFVNPQSRDAFVALFLEHRVSGVPSLKHSGAPTLSYRWHGQLWSRAPLTAQTLPAGAELHERNAYVVRPYDAATSPAELEALRRCLTHRLRVTSGRLPSPLAAVVCGGRLARPGENADAGIPKAALWEALRDCKDAQLYTADVSVVDLGLVYDVRVRGGTVVIVLAMPHRGRPRAGYFGHGSISVHPTASLPIRERLLKVPGVTSVVIEQSWEPGWSSNRLTDDGRRKLGLPG